MIRPSIRLRVTAWYTAVALAGGLLLIAGSFVIALRHIDRYAGQVDSLAQRIPSQNPQGGRPTTLPTRAELEAREADLRAGRAARATAEERVRVRVRRSLLLELAALLGGFTLIAVATGLFVTRRVLAPVKRITDAARTVGATSLGERLRLTGPDDELKELADTFDAMLERVEQAFAREREFIASASHELRTPLAIIRAEIDAARSSRGQVHPATRRSFDVIETAADRSAQLTTSLLSLSRANRELTKREPVNLRLLAEECLREQEASIAAGELAVRRSLADAWVAGDHTLLHRLVSNLVDNAVRYNYGRGALMLAAASTDRSSILTVENDGARLDAAEVRHLLEPFNRGNAQDGPRSGLGLGLAIAESITHAHDGMIVVAARKQGGLRVSVRFPAFDRLATAPPGELQPAR